MWNENFGDYVEREKSFHAIERSFDQNESTENNSHRVVVVDDQQQNITGEQSSRILDKELQEKANDKIQVEISPTKKGKQGIQMSVKFHRRLILPKKYPLS
jgi:hypothetical protein